MMSIKLNYTVLASPIVFALMFSGSDLGANEFVTRSCVPNADVQMILELHNQQRSEGARCGRKWLRAASPLSFNCQLAEAALKHTQDMAENGFMGHQGSDGSDISARANKVKYSWQRLGENVAKGLVPPVKINDMWLASRDHCKNIMNREFTEMGAARINDYWTVMFGRQQ